MPYIENYLAHAERDMDPESAAALRQVALIDDLAFPFIVGGCDTLCGIELEPGIGNTVRIVSETLAQIANDREMVWIEPGEGKDYPDKALHVRRCRRFPHSPLEDLFIIDIGPKRVVLAVPSDQV